MMRRAEGRRWYEGHGSAGFAEGLETAESGSFGGKLGQWLGELAYETIRRQARRKGGGVEVADDMPLGPRTG